MTLQEIAVKYYDTTDMNCSESIMHAANDFYQMNLNETDFKLLAGFGAGCSSGSLCGAIAAGVAVIGALKIEDQWRGSASVKITKGFIAACREKLGSELCKEIKSNHFSPAVRCEKVVSTVAQILEETLA